MSVACLYFAVGPASLAVVYSATAWRVTCWRAPTCYNRYCHIRFCHIRVGFHYESWGPCWEHGRDAPWFKAPHYPPSPPAWRMHAHALPTRMTHECVLIKYLPPPPLDACMQDASLRPATTLACPPGSALSGGWGGPLLAGCPMACSLRPLACTGDAEPLTREVDWW